MVLNMDPTKSYDPSQWFSVSKLYDPRAQVKQNRPNNKPPLPAPQLRLSDPRLTHSRTLVQDEYGSYEISSTTATENDTNSFVPAPAPVVTEQSSSYNREKYDPRKLEYYISSFQTEVESIDPEEYEYRNKFPYDMICQLAHAVLDGTVFEIIKGLQDIQAITEENLNAKRKKLVNEQKSLKCDMLKRQQTEYSGVQNKPHRLLVAEKQHEEEKTMFQQRAEKELNSLDQRLVLELDRQTSDQQATLQRAGLPFFFITNEPEDIKLQMYVLSFIIRLSATIAS